MGGERHMGSAGHVQGSELGWSDAIGSDRKAELKRLISEWEAMPEADRGEWRGPFDRREGKTGLALSGADVFWLAARALAIDAGKGVADDAIAEAEEQLRQTNDEDTAPIVLQVEDPPSLDALHLEHASLRGVHLERAILTGAHLDGADLRDAHLESANLRDAHLNRAVLVRCHLKGAILTGAHLQRANLAGGRLDNAVLRDAHLIHAYLVRTYLRGAHLEGAELAGAQLSDARAEGAHLEGAHLEGAILLNANLERAHLLSAHLEGTNLARAQLAWADLRDARMDSNTNLAGAVLGRAGRWERFMPWSKPATAALGDIHWDGVGTVDLTRVADNWAAVKRLGDERVVGWRDGATKHQNVVRAYQQVATQLRAQGLSDVADRLSYRAHVLNRRVLLRKLRIPRYVGSRLLAVLAGYGYRPGRTLLWYLATVAFFTFAYFQVTHSAYLGPLRFAAPSDVPPLQWNEALILSVSAFHGRGFFQPLKSLGDPVAGLAALEAVVGLLIEISFIATFTQRFFGSR